MRSAYKIVVAEPEWKRSLGIPRHRWEHNIKTDLNEKVRKYADWIRGCIQKFPDWPHGARTANGVAVCH
jgi:hypothetical protein